MATFSMAALSASLPTIQAARPSSSRPAAPTMRLASYTGMSASGRLNMAADRAAECSSLSMAPSNGATVFAMRHAKRIPKLGKPADQRKALLRSLTTEVLRHGKITTTVTRARAVRKWVDKMITLAKGGSLHERRQAMAWVYDKELVAALFEEVPKRYADRNGGYCSVKREFRARRGDNAELASCELC